MDRWQKPHGTRGKNLLGQAVESDNNSKALELRIIASHLLKMADDLEHSTGTTSDLKPALPLNEGPASPDEDFTGAYAQAIFRDRQRRAKYLPTVPFADPAWDLLLDLYFRGAKGEIVTVSNACMAAGVPTTTALRWIDILIDLGLVTREADVADRRRILLHLTDDAREKLKAYFSQLMDSNFIPSG